MSLFDWKSLVGKRLLVTDAATRTARNEWKLLEVSPSGRRLKFHNIDADTKFWDDENDVVLLEILP